MGGLNGVQDYCTRHGIVYVGRGTPVGNPWRTGYDGTREEIHARYKKWLVAQLNKDHEVLGFLWKLRDESIIACWCCESERPGDREGKTCHAEIIRDVWLEHIKPNLL